jgi:hypothetical protein
MSLATIPFVDDSSLFGGPVLVWVSDGCSQLPTLQPAIRGIAPTRALNLIDPDICTP